jgi:7-cyano-7-deazaguanine synthase
VLAGIGDSALTREVAFEMGKHGLPNTFVPGRNLLFLTIAAAVAYRRGIEVLVGGMCETDFSGYPDCRDTTLKAMQAALTLGLDRRVAIETPLMWIDKAATWQMARELGGERLIELILEDSVTCYLGERGARHAWGYGCGSCPSCELRRRGHEKWLGSRHA